MTTRKSRRRMRPHLAPVLTGDGLRHVKALLRERDGDGCFFCLDPMGADCTLEHLHRWADGGGNDLSNLALAHRDCNWDTKELTVDQKMLLRGDVLLARLQAEAREAA